MRKLLQLTAGLMLCLLSLTSNAQTYSAWGVAVNQTGHMYDTLTTAGDSLRFVFNNTHATAWGTPKLVVYYEGNFGDWFDYMDVYDETLSNFNSTNPSSFGFDCGPEDSTVFSLTPASINAWTANNSIVFTLIPNSGNGFCAFSRVRARLVYNYCLSGTPAQYANLTISNPFVCSSDAPYTLTGTPAGGTFSGPGVSGATFNPAGLSSGAYVLQYTATDSQTCTTTGNLSVIVKARPLVSGVVNDTLYACNGSSVALDASLGNGFTWYSNAALTSSLATGSSYATPSLTQNTNYWVTSQDLSFNMGIASVTSNSFAIKDHNAITGDDRGGIAVTQNYVFLNGDNAAVRYDLNLTPSSATQLPIRDGMFSDLQSGKLWSLWDQLSNSAPNSPSSFNVTALRGLDNNLNFTNDYITLSQPINMGTNNQQSGIFAGAGYLGLYSGNTQHWYVIDLDNGIVSDLGFLNDPEFYGSENWSDWGVLESNCSGAYSVVYRDYNDDNIHRRVLPNGAVTTVGTFNDLSDMASLTFNPWNSRWYWHYEGGSSVFGGSSETIGYAAATIGTYTGCPGSGQSCPTEVSVIVPADVTFNMTNTVVCLSNGAIQLNSGAPAGGNYSGIGVGTSTNGTVFYPALSGTGTFTLSYTYTDSKSGCTDAASGVVNVDECTGIEKQTALGGISIYPNPNNGSFFITAGSDVATLHIEVLDLQARVVYTSQESGMTTGSTKELNLDVPNGVYMVKLSNGTAHAVQRVVIMK